MPRHSEIKRRSTEWRRYFDRLIRDDRWTLDEMLQKMRSRFPDEKPPSRSSAGRYTKNIKELGVRMRDIQAAGTALVSELGEDPNDCAGQLLVQAVTSLATHAALKATDPEADELSIKEVGQLARGARAVLEARKMSLAERKEIERLAREKAAEEAGDAAREDGVSETTIQRIRARVMRGGA